MIEIAPSNDSATSHWKELAVTKTDSFHRFNDLPWELRHTIWILALPGPRIIHLEQARLQLQPHLYSRVRSDMPIDSPKDTTPDSHEEILLQHFEPWQKPLQLTFGFRGYYCGVRSKFPPPAMLYVNREAYDVVSKIYTRAFGTKDTFPDTWIDFERDIVFLDWDIADSEFMKMLIELRWEELRRVKNLLTKRSRIMYARLSRHRREIMTVNMLKGFGNVKVLRMIEPRSEDSDRMIEILDMSVMEKSRIQDEEGGGIRWKMPKVEYSLLSELTRAWNWKLQDWDDNLLAIESLAGYMD